VSSKTLRFAVSLVTMALSAFALEGCPPCGRDVDASVGAWRFEDCTDSACGLTVVSGSTRVTTTFHPGEHGLELASGTTIQGSLSSGLSSPYGMPALKVIARCDAGTSLAVELDLSTVTRNDATGASTTTEPTDETVRGGLSPTNAWAVANTSFFVTGTVSRLRAVRLSTMGPGRCQIDNLEVTQSFYGFCE
jgi:hypothetical protein